MCFVLWLVTFALDPSALSIRENKTFMLKTYEYNLLSQDYDLAGYGSAYQVWQNLLLTNAHVVSDEDGEIVPYIKACQWSFTEDKWCEYVAQVVKYDEENDLALLVIESRRKKIMAEFFTENFYEDPQWRATVFPRMQDGTLGFISLDVTGVKPQIGSTIHVLGFPDIWGETLTYNKGVVNGQLDGWYKTDANIDHGNSGGPVFDDAWSLVGIMTAIKTNNNTVAYFVPGDVIQNFLQISQYTLTRDQDFLDDYTYNKELFRNENAFRLGSVEIDNIYNNYRWSKPQILSSKEGRNGAYMQFGWVNLFVTQSRLYGETHTHLYNSVIDQKITPKPFTLGGQEVNLVVMIEGTDLSVLFDRYQWDILYGISIQGNVVRDKDDFIKALLHVLRYTKLNGPVTRTPGQIQSFVLPGNVSVDYDVVAQFQPVWVTLAFNTPFNDMTFLELQSQGPRENFYYYEDIEEFKDAFALLYGKEWQAYEFDNNAVLYVHYDDLYDLQYAFVIYVIDGSMYMYSLSTISETDMTEQFKGFASSLRGNSVFERYFQ